MELWLAAAAALSPEASAHEVRPGYLEITQPRTNEYDVTWKQPARGELALHLDPHLSNGWLERSADQQYASGGFLIRRWVIRSSQAMPLAGRTIEIEGLANTLTDVLVRVRLDNDQQIDAIIHPESPSLVLSAGARGPRTITAYVRLGIDHILTGPDHLLFLLGLILIVRQRMMLLKTVSAFTVAHTITLTATTLDWLTVPPRLVEAIIALSILFLAPEILRVRAGRGSLTIRYPWLVAFAFGSFHGMGFASGLKSLGLHSGDLLVPLGFFNLGVEFGQLAFIALILALGRLLQCTPIVAYAPAVKLPAYVVGIAGAYWTLQASSVWWGLR